MSNDILSKLGDLQQGPRIDGKDVAKKVMSLLPTVVMAIIMFSISALSTLIQFDFRLEDVVWSSLLILVVTRIALQVCAKYIGAETRVGRGKNGPRVTKARDEFLAMAESVDTSRFYSWVEEENERLKASAYRRDNDRRLARLQVRLSHAMYRAGVHQRKRRVRCVERIQERIRALQSVNTDAYIAEHLPHLRVRFRPLRACDFLTPSEYTDERERYAISIHKENMIKIVKGLPLVFAMSLLSALIGFSSMRGAVNVISLLTDLLAVGMNLFMGAVMVGGTALDALTNVYVARKTVLARFLASATTEVAKPITE